MTSQELSTYIGNLLSKGIPYKAQPPFSLEEGFNCFGWVMFLTNKLRGEQNDLHYDLNKLKILETDYRIVQDTPKFMDVPMFYLNTIEPRHIGLMLDEQTFTQCSDSTNGVSITNINRAPWKIILRAVYRRK